MFTSHARLLRSRQVILGHLPKSGKICVNTAARAGWAMSRDAEFCLGGVYPESQPQRAVCTFACTFLYFCVLESN